MKRRKRIAIIPFCLILWMSTLLGTMPAKLHAGTRFVTIGSGDITGVYYPTGLIIAKMINDKREEYGVRCGGGIHPGICV